MIMSYFLPFNQQCRSGRVVGSGSSNNIIKQSQHHIHTGSTFEPSDCYKFSPILAGGLMAQRLGPVTSTASWVQFLSQAYCSFSDVTSAYSQPCKQVI